MLPVSGAAQLNASGAMMDLPVISHSKAYSICERPETDGKNRFQRPIALAFAFSSSMIGGFVVHLLSPVPIYEMKTFSFPKIYLSMK